MKSRIKEYFVYMLRTSANTLYTGYTNDLAKRIREHQSKGKRAAKYTRAFRAVTLVYSESFTTKQEAMKREWKLKQLSHAEKEKLVAPSHNPVNSIK